MRLALYQTNERNFKEIEARGEGRIANGTYQAWSVLSVFPWAEVLNPSFSLKILTCISCPVEGSSSHRHFLTRMSMAPSLRTRSTPTSWA